MWWFGGEGNDDQSAGEAEPGFRLGAAYGSALLLSLLSLGQRGGGATELE